MAMKPCSVVLNQKEVEEYLTHKRRIDSNADVLPPTVLLKDSSCKKMKVMDSNPPPGGINFVPVLNQIKAEETGNMSQLTSQEQSFEQSRLSSNTFEAHENKSTEMVPTELIVTQPKSLFTNEEPTINFEIVRPTLKGSPLVSLNVLEGVELKNETLGLDIAVIAIHCSSISRANEANFLGVKFSMLTAILVHNNKIKSLKNMNAKDTLKLSSVRDHAFKCQICLKTFAVPENLVEHIQNVHPLKYQCITCKEKPVCLKDIAAHLFEKHKGKFCNDNSLLVTLLLQCSEPSYIFNCVLCKESIVGNSSDALFNHVSSTHNLCKICGSTFQHASDLIKHNEYHSQTADSYHCTVCKVSFRRYKFLLSHFEDNICSNTLKKFSIVKKPYARYNVSTASKKCHFCPYCNVKFSLGDVHSLLYHISFHISKDCIYCAQNFIFIAHPTNVTSSVTMCESCLWLENLQYNVDPNPQMLSNEPLPALENQSTGSVTNKSAVTEDEFVSIKIVWAKCDAQTINTSISEIISKVKSYPGNIPQTGSIYHCESCEVNINVEKDLFKHICEYHDITFKLLNETITLQSLHSLLSETFDVKFQFNVFECYIGNIIAGHSQTVSCRYCNNMFLIAELFQHVLSTHPTCRSCHLLFPTTLALQEHIDSHNKGLVNFYKCLKCSALANGHISFVNHYFKNHGNKLNENNFFEMFNRTYAVTSKFSIKYLCPYCPTSTYSNVSYLKHLSLHYMKQCEHCNENYLYYDYTQRYSIVHSCKVLDKDIPAFIYEQFKQSIYLQNHINKAIIVTNKNLDGAKSKIEIFLPEMTQSKEIAHTSSKTMIQKLKIIESTPSSCTQPQIMHKVSNILPITSYKKNAILQYHSDATKALVLSRSQDIFQNLLSSLLCLFCKVTFTSVSSFNNHVLDVHHVCRICCITFKNSSEMFTHINSHLTGKIRFFTCKTCTVEFKSYPALKLHCYVKKHEFIGNYITSDPKYLEYNELFCPYCPQHFQSSQNFVKHVECHVLVSCDICKHVFVPSLYELHSKSITSITCYLCLQQIPKGSFFPAENDILVAADYTPVNRFSNLCENVIIDGKNCKIKSEVIDDIVEPIEVVPFESVLVKEEHSQIIETTEIDVPNYILSCKDIPPVSSNSIIEVQKDDTINYINTLHFSGSTVIKTENIISNSDYNSTPDIDMKMKEVEVQEDIKPVVIKEEQIIANDEEVDLFNGCIFQTTLNTEESLFN